MISRFTQAIVQAHTNLTEIDSALDLLWRNNIEPSKVNLGLGFYGRSFTLKDPSCKEPGCPFSDGGNPGECTDTSGILSYDEIKKIIRKQGLTPVLDKTAAVKYMSWNSDQWVSYDDKETFQMKLQYANEMCLGGTMVWAMDLDSVGDEEDEEASGINALLRSTSNLSLRMRSTLKSANAPMLSMFWTACQPPETANPCPPGYTQKATGYGKVFDADLSHLTGEGCHGS